LVTAPVRFFSPQPFLTDLFEFPQLCIQPSGTLLPFGWRRSGLVWLLAFVDLCHPLSPFTGRPDRPPRDPAFSWVPFSVSSFALERRWTSGSRTHLISLSAIRFLMRLAPCLTVSFHDRLVCGDVGDHRGLPVRSPWKLRDEFEHFLLGLPRCGPTGPCSAPPFSRAPVFT